MMMSMYGKYSVNTVVAMSTTEVTTMDINVDNVEVAEGIELLFLFYKNLRAIVIVRRLLH
jgi:hypothetical protein